MCIVHKILIYICQISKITVNKESYFAFNSNDVGKRNQPKFGINY